MQALPLICWVGWLKVSPLGCQHLCTSGGANADISIVDSYCPLCSLYNVLKKVSVVCSGVCQTRSTNEKVSIVAR
jgi:hypothetical protein